MSAVALIASLVDTSKPAVGSSLVVLAALPMLNAVFDFGSLGLTRWALRWGVNRVGWRTVLASLGDLVAAGVLFLALGCACIAYIHLLNSVAAAPIWALGPYGHPGIDRHGLFTDLRARPQEFWWLYLTFLSTLLPTLVHAAVAVWSIGPAVLRTKSRLWIANRLERSTQDFGVRVPTLALLSAWSAFAVAVPIILLVWAGGWIAEVHPEWGLALLDFFEWFYHRLPGA